ncbi:MAG TPA: phosphatase PAP2 family protein [Puia sp.]|nr:phosphatase PAP2 family protein [Puia sp.]
MNDFERVVIEYVFKLFSRSYYFFHTIEFMAADNLLKGGVIAVIFWYLWFKADPDIQVKRIQLIATLISVFFVMIITLSIAGITPFRYRPFLNPDFHFNSLIPFNEPLTKLSSFPSDHAALFTSLATGFYFVSRKTGIITMFFVYIYLMFPRLYLGYHYPTDILAGTVLGVSITAFFLRSDAVKSIISKTILPFSINYPEYFYACLFVVTYQIADLFGGAREIIGYVHNLYKHQF